MPAHTTDDRGEITLDDFRDIGGWLAVASGEARLDISRDEGPSGHCLRLDFDFHGGGGFAVARKEFPRDMPEAFAFRFRVRGEAPANNFEFKLADPSGRNVWWWHRKDFPFAPSWREIEIRGSQIEFAWGPAGGGPIRRLGAMELAITAGPGGKGTVWIDAMRFEDLTPAHPPGAKASTSVPGHEPARIFDDPPGCGWRSEPAPGPQWLELDFLRPREFGGLVIDWEPGHGAAAFDVEVSDDGAAWRTLHTARDASGVRACLYLPASQARHLRLGLLKATAGRGFGIRALAVKPFEFSRSLNDFFSQIAQARPRGRYPKYLLREQTYWSPIAPPESPSQAILNEEGMVEVDIRQFSIEPFVFDGERLITWADAEISQSLEQGHLPIPSSAWRTPKLVLTTTAFATGAGDDATLFIRYRIENTVASALRGRFFAAIRPFQVTPPWQAWKGLGGVAGISSIRREGGAVRINGGRVVAPQTGASGFGAAAFHQGDITEYLESGALPARDAVEDPFGHASGAWAFELDLPPGGSREFFLAIPFGPQRTGETPPRPGPDATRAIFLEQEAIWRDMLAQPDLHLPAAAAPFAATLKTALAHILVCRDGHAIQPGPRRYTRSWIRDGAIMGAALLRCGLPNPVRDFLRWYAPHQAADGNVPCCVDRDGPDWLPEHDSHGQLVYLAMEHFRFTGDAGLLEEMWPHVEKAAAFIDALRRQRMTPEYDAPDKRARRGILPESASHEGYLAHPVHSYWDDFWALRGLKDAASIAGILGREPEMARWLAMYDSLRQCLAESIRTTMQQRGIPFVPGSVEWADFDPTATAIAVSLLDAADQLPLEGLDHLFREYLEGVRKRRSGETDWNNYSAYEVRIVGALVCLGMRREAADLAGFFIGDRRPSVWNQWPEISWRNPRSAGHLGDLPHCWIGAEFILAFRTMLAFERESDASLVIAAGVPEDWLADPAGVSVARLPTYYGHLECQLRSDGPGALRFSLASGLEHPPGGVILKPPLPGPIIAVEARTGAVKAFDETSVTLDGGPAEIAIRFR